MKYILFQKLSDFDYKVAGEYTDIVRAVQVLKEKEIKEEGTFLIMKQVDWEIKEKE